MKGSNAHSRIASKDYGVAQSFTLTWNGQKNVLSIILKVWWFFGRNSQKYQCNVGERRLLKLTVTCYQVISKPDALLLYNKLSIFLFPTINKINTAIYSR